MSLKSFVYFQILDDWRSKVGNVNAIKDKYDEIGKCHHGNI